MKVEADAVRGMSLSKQRDAARTCRNCELYRDATQTVFGAGPAGASMMMVGEQPGDQEDRAGEPFVGPAGRLLDRALDDAGIDRSTVYVTNAVKHFKFTERGKRRIHQTPSRTEVVACRPWLLGELARVEPTLVVCLGAVAAKSLLGPSFRVTHHRGEILDLPDSTAKVTATVHPSAVLRAPDRDEAYGAFVDDLAAARRAMT
ncbi:MAG TPA: UdgX family uracil-DNA binding protein [Actinophytocola sp.]|jgi:DNA polymerase|nr:UdgX family uracil-DNA binding protein [Actinophytocola sp.]